MRAVRYVKLQRTHLENTCRFPQFEVVMNGILKWAMTLSVHATLK
jgi:galactose-1-phosphate uridylyltransferase